MAATKKSYRRTAERFVVSEIKRRILIETRMCADPPAPGEEAERVYSETKLELWKAALEAVEHKIAESV